MFVSFHRILSISCGELIMNSGLSCCKVCRLQNPHVHAITGRDALCAVRISVSESPI